MSDNNRQNKKFQQLREIARALFQEKLNTVAVTDENSLDDILTELEIRQIELEAQNEELQKAKKELEKTKEKYHSLFMFAPVGYFILNREGIISEVNLTAADMLKRTRKRLLDRRFIGLVADNERNSFQQTLSQSNQSTESISAHIHLEKANDERFLARVVCDNFDGKEEMFRLTVMDESQTEEIQELEEKSKQLKKLSSHLYQVREEEREKAAKLIHDELGQSLTATKMDLVWVKNQIPEEQNVLREKIEEMIRNVETNIYSAQKITSELRPGMIHELGLEAAIEWEIESVRNNIGVQCEFHPDFDDTALDSLVALDVFRIIKELLINTVRHAGATAIFLELHRESDCLKIRFRDNGKGTTQEDLNASDAFGIMNIKERVNNYGGDVEFDTGISAGLEVTISLPVFNGK